MIELLFLHSSLECHFFVDPASVRTDRECNADYNFKNMKIKKGTIWSVSIWCLHHDPSIYPEPEKFIPERYLLK